MIPREGPLGAPIEEAAEAVASNNQTSEPAEQAAEETTLAALSEEAKTQELLLQTSSGEPNAGTHTRRTAEDAPTKKLGADAREETPATAAPTRKSEEEITFGGRTLNYGMIFKFLGLLAFFGLLALIVHFVWPTIADIFDQGGVALLVEKVQEAGPVGVLILLGFQFLQIVVAFIPGEVVQIAAGMMYGPWLGALVIVVGCVISSAFIYWLVHKLGAPFVQAMVPERFMGRVEDFEKSGKLNVVVFVLFLIPGLPKDTFTYLVPLTSMRMRDFLIISNVARIPGILLSTYGASSIIKGNILDGAILFAVAAALAALGLYASKKYLDYKMEKEDPEEFRKVVAQREAKKAERQAKRAKRKAKRAKKKATKRAKAYEEYKEAQTRMKQYDAARAHAFTQEQARIQQQVQQVQQAQQAQAQAQQTAPRDQ